MYSILIVDDEPVIRQGLRVLVDWRRHGFSIDGEAGDGEEALRMIAVRRFDLLLVDIRLPGVSGLDLIAALPARPSPPRIVILSAHAEFEYARAAVALGVRRYLVKPVDEEELSRTLVEIRGELDAERRVTTRDEIARLLRILVHAERATERRDLVRRLGKAGLRPGPVSCCLVLRVADPDGQQHVAAACQEWLARHRAGYLLEDGPDGLFVTLQNVRLQGGVVDDRAGKLREAVCRRVGATVDMTVGDPVEDLLDLGRSYWSARNRLLLEPGDAGGDRPEVSGATEPSLSAEAIGRAIRDADTEAVDREIDALAARIARTSEAASTVHATVIALLLLLGDLVPDGGYVARVDAQARAEDTRAMIAVLREASRAACRAVAAASEGVIATLRNYLDQHCTERITMKAIADRFGYNASYLGRAFARRTGTSVREFIAVCRIRRACRMLLDGNLKAYAVAAQAGFSDLNSFYAAFRKQKGCTPREYRIKIAQGLAQG